MLPIDFAEANKTYEKPNSMTDEECSSLRVCERIEDGHKVIYSVWKPNKEDVEAINEGRPIILRMIIPVMIPVMLYTTDENLQPNII